MSATNLQQLPFFLLRMIHGEDQTVALTYGDQGDEVEENVQKLAQSNDKEDNITLTYFR